MENNVWSGFVSWLISNTGAILLGVVLAALAGFLKARATPYSHLVDPVLYAIGTFFLVLGVIVLFRHNSSLNRNQPVTTATVESKLRSWIDDYKIGSKKHSGETDKYFFQYELTLAFPAALTRQKEFPEYVYLQSRLHLTGEQAVGLRKLAAEQVAELTLMLQRDLAGTGVISSVELPGPGITGPSPGIALALGIPIVDLNPEKFRASVQMFESASFVARASTLLGLKNLGAIAEITAQTPPR